MGPTYLGLYVFMLYIIVSFNCSAGPPAGGSNGRCRIRCGPSGSRPGNFNEDDLIDRSNVRGGYASTRHGSFSDTHGATTGHSHGQTNPSVMVTDRHGVPQPTAPAIRYRLRDTSETFDLVPWFQHTFDAYHRGENPRNLQIHRFITVIPHIGVPVWIELLWIWTNHPQEISIAIFVPNPDNIAGLYRRRVRRMLNTITIRTSMFLHANHARTGSATRPILLRPLPPHPRAGQNQGRLPNELGVLDPFSTWYYSVLSDDPHEELVGHIGGDYLHHLADGHGPLHDYFSNSDEEDDRGQQNHGHHNNQHGHNQHGIPDAEAEIEPHYSIETFHRRFLVEDILRRGSVIMLRTDLIIDDEPSMDPS